MPYAYTQTVLEVLRAQPEEKLDAKVVRLEKKVDRLDHKIDVKSDEAKRQASVLFDATKEQMQ